MGCDGLVLAWLRGSGLIGGRERRPISGPAHLFRAKLVDGVEVAVDLNQPLEHSIGDPAWIEPWAFFSRFFAPPQLEGFDSVPRLHEKFADDGAREKPVKVMSGSEARGLVAVRVKEKLGRAKGVWIAALADVLFRQTCVDAVAAQVVLSRKRGRPVSFSTAAIHSSRVVHWTLVPGTGVVEGRDSMGCSCWGRACGRVGAVTGSIRTALGRGFESTCSRFQRAAGPLQARWRWHP